jgi:hypothetical protein
LDLQGELKHLSRAQLTCYGKPPYNKIKRLVILLPGNSEQNKEMSCYTFAVG